MDRRFDFLIIGSGIAGLFYALKIIKANPKAKIAIITKKGETVSSTNWAQGGIAAVLSGTDSFASHIADTLATGCGLSKKEVVEKVVAWGPSAIEELISYGVQFTKSETLGNLDLGREGGHSANRVAHASDLTGKEIERALLAACRAFPDTIHFFRDHMVVDLILSQSGGLPICAGVHVFSGQDRIFESYYAPVTLLATGGLGHVYFHTSNPRIATGDGIAIAYRAGVSIANLEFIQFHPTTLYSPGRWPFLISEAVRGEGGILKTIDGNPFMREAHERADLAPRDVVARAIDREMKRSGDDYVLLDVSHLDAVFIKDRFPNIYKECLKYGFDITVRPIPVVPSAHYSCGGILSTLSGETELPGLFVAGEVAMSGMHGANRLASNSLLEAVCMAKFAAEKSSQYFHDISFPESPQTENPLFSSLRYPREKVLITYDRQELQRVMSDFVGIVRTIERLELALLKVSQMKKAIENYYFATPATLGVLELRNLATVAELIIRSALRRRESRGLHYLEDIPKMDDAFLGDTIITGRLKAEAS
ncbi:MAG: L-aspartate oxidase [candidate division Zixibacteria bacterium]|nr:L-aspartate oxidase [candidate division Zixibacteria bacterium]